MEFNEGYASSTHQPLIRAVLDLYKPEYVLELGVGMYSTPLFKDVKYLGIENNKEWIDYVNLPNIIHHDVGDIKIDTTLGSLSKEQRRNVISFYKGLKIPKFSLLFVDNYASLRTLAINTLRKRFDFIIFHDCEHAGIMWYRYDLIKINGFKLYYLKSPTAWTALMVRNDKGFDELYCAIKPYMEAYSKEYNINMKLTNEY